MNTDRYDRQQRIKGWDQQALRRAYVLVVGAGALGGSILLCLCKMGFGISNRITVTDFDHCEFRNLATQWFRSSDVLMSQSKVQALGEMVSWICEREIHPVQDRFTGAEKRKLGPVVILAVDSLQVRLDIWNQLRKRDDVELLLDARMGAEVLEVFSLDPRAGDSSPAYRSYEQSLQRPEQAVQEPCTRRGILYTTLGAAAFVGSILRAHAQGTTYPRYLAFDFVYEVGDAAPIAYRHYWDVGTGAYRVEGMLDEEQTPYVVIFNVNTREGNAWIAGKPALGEDLARLLEDAYGRFINDSYWLIMPLKLLDPGVHLHHEGEVSSETGVRDRIRVSFDPGIGLTPGDVYWIEVDRKSGRMVRWEFILEGDEEKYGYSWTEWGKYGPLNLSTVKEYDDGSERILLLNVIASRELDAEPFRPPDVAQASDPI